MSEGDDKEVFMIDIDLSDTDTPNPPARRVIRTPGRPPAPRDASQPNPILTVRVDPFLYQRLHEHARLEDRTVGQQINRILRRYFDVLDGNI